MLKTIAFLIRLWPPPKTANKRKKITDLAKARFHCVLQWFLKILNGSVTPNVHCVLVFINENELLKTKVGVLNLVSTGTESAIL